MVADLASFPSFFLSPATPAVLRTLSLHDALPISHRAARNGALLPATGRRLLAPPARGAAGRRQRWRVAARGRRPRSEEHTSELQSRFDLVCRLLLEKKKRVRNRQRAACARAARLR